MDLIRLEGLSRRFGKTLALDRADARLAPGAIGLLGPNGAGKSTLLKVLLGLLDPSSGRAEILGLDPRTAGREIRRRVGYLPENDAFAPGLSALDLVALAGELSGIRRGQALRRAHEVLTYLGVEEARYRLVEEQSTGVRQRIKLAQALVHDPELLILDEPTNGLDPTGRRAMLLLIESLHREFGKSVILSSHLLEDVDRVCDSLIILQGGRIAACGRTEELRLDLRRRFRLTLRGAAPLYLQRLAAQGVKAVAPPEESPDGWEALVEAPEGWPGRRFFELLGPAGDGGTVLLSLVPERERLADLFQRLTRRAAPGGRDGD